LPKSGLSGAAKSTFPGPRFAAKGLVPGAPQFSWVK
jgi:hypothetical protein